MGSDGQSAWDGYILDYHKTIKAMDALNKGKYGHSVSYRLHCSRPFFRLFICDDVAFIQTYDKGAHGHMAPIYQVKSGRDSLFNLAQDIFNFHWDRGFLLDSPDEISDPLAIYLAKMHGISYKYYLNDIDALKETIIANCSSLLQQAEDREETALE